MRVLYINNTKEYPGSTISLLNLFKGLKNNGVEMLVVGPKMKNPKLIQELNELGIKYEFIYNEKNIWPQIRKDSIISFIWSLVKWPIKLGWIYYHMLISQYFLNKIINDFKPDIIHSNSGVIHEGIVCANQAKIPHVIHLREYQDLDFGMSIFPSKRKFESLLHKTYVITITKDILCHFHLEGYNKARVIYNGIYPKDKTLKIWPKDNYFLCCSRISASKGHENVIRSFASFSKKHPDYKLRICGYGTDEYVGYLKKISRQLHCHDKIEWMGFTDKPFENMARARALIVASRSEGFGRMTAEAAFAGCVVIGRNTGGTKEILSSTGGYLFDSDKEMEVAMNAVAEMSHDEYLTLIGKAQSYARDYYSNEANVSKTYDFYNYMLQTTD